MSEELNQNKEIEYQEYEGNLFLIDNGLLKDVLVENETVRIPEEVRVIRRAAFLNARMQNRMERLVIPASVKKIEKLTFAGMESLQCVEILSGITKLEPGTFRNCGGLLKVVLPESLIRIESRAFENCVQLSEVVFGSSNVMMSEDAFLNCLSLKNKQIEEGIANAYRMRREEKERNKRIPFVRRPLTDSPQIQEQNKEIVSEPVPETLSAEIENADTEFCIRDGVLEQCEIGCSHIILPEGIKKIGSGAFEHSAQRELLERVDIPEGVLELDARAFYGLKNLKEIRIPSSVKYFGAEVFEGTAWLQQERKKKSCVCINGVLISAFYDSMVLEAKLPDGVWRIAPYAFYHNDVRRIRIPDSVRVIDAYAFFKVGMTEIEFPNHEELTLHNPVIAGCNSLKELQIPEKIERIEAGFVENCPALQVVCLKGAQTVVNKRAFPENVRIWVI